MQNRLASVIALIGIILLGVTTAAQASKCQHPFAKEIISATPHVDKDPEDILGAPDGIAADFDNDGATPSTVVVAFASPIINREGNDFSITYWDLPETQRQETSEVLVKGPGYNDFTKIGLIEPVYGLTERKIFHVAYFDLDTLGWDSVDQVMVRNLVAKTSNPHEGLDIDGFTAIHCEDHHELPADNIALHISGLRNTKATCWNTTTHDVVLARTDRDGRHSCTHLFADQHDDITISVVGSSTVNQ